MYELAKCEELATSNDDQDDAAAAPNPPRDVGDGGCRRRARSLAGDGEVDGDGEPPAAAAATATPLCGDGLLVSSGSRRTPTCSACAKKTAHPPPARRLIRRRGARYVCYQQRGWDGTRRETRCGEREGYTVVDEH